MRIGLIGAGHVGVNAHIPAVQANDGMTIAAVADPTPERLRAAADAAGLGADDLFADWRDLIAREDIDAVIVATPQRFRPEIVIAAAEAGKHILAEKPLALTPAEARSMIDAAREHGVTLATVHNYHFMPVYQDIKEVLDSGEIGQPEIAVLNYLGVEDRPGAAAYSPRWRHSAADSGGGVLMDMLHVVYLANWFMGGPPVAVSAWVDKRLGKRRRCRGPSPSCATATRMARADQHGLGRRTRWRRDRWYSGSHGDDQHGFGTHPFVPAERLDVVSQSGSRSWTPAEAVAYGMAGIGRQFLGCGGFGDRADS
jgi:predicted dehydrogenase